LKNQNGVGKTMLSTKSEIRNPKQYLIAQIPNSINKLFGTLKFGICLGFSLPIGMAD